MIERNELIEKIIAIAKENLDIDNEDMIITEDTDLIKQAGFDSMDVVSLGIEIEDVFGTSLSPEDFSSIDVTPSAVTDLILSKLKKLESA